MYIFLSFCRNSENQILFNVISRKTLNSAIFCDIEFTILVFEEKATYFFRINFAMHSFLTNEIFYDLNVYNLMYEACLIFTTLKDLKITYSQN